MSRLLLNLAGRRCRLVKLCGLSLLLKPISDHVLGLVGEKRCFERGQLFVGLETTEPFDGHCHVIGLVGGDLRP